MPSSASSSAAGDAAGLQRAQHRQGVHALDHVVAGRLAELVVGGGDVEDVVDDLEHHAEASPYSVSASMVGRSKLGDEAADAGRRARTATPSCR